MSPSLVQGTIRPEWRRLVNDAVDKVSDEERDARLATFPSARDYVVIKEWGTNTTAYTLSSGEDGRMCQHVAERYLDDRNDWKGTRLQVLVPHGLFTCDGQSLT